MKRVSPGEFEEEVVLLIVAILGRDAYGVKITHEIIEQTDRTVRLNQVHAFLHRLENKRMVISMMSDPTPLRRGRSKRIFTITAYGQQTLSETKAVRFRHWNLGPSSITIVGA